MENIHERMPVVLEAQQFDEWLDPEVHEADSDRRLAETMPSELVGIRRGVDSREQATEQANQTSS
jgi:putative SOS response-associated peptidase YedK